MKNPAIILGSIAVLMWSAQVSAAPKHHPSRTDRVAVQRQPRNVDTYAYWPDARPFVYEPEPGSLYSGGWSAPAGR